MLLFLSGFLVGTFLASKVFLSRVKYLKRKLGESIEFVNENIQLNRRLLQRIDGGSLLSDIPVLTDIEKRNKASAMKRGLQQPL